MLSNFFASLFWSTNTSLLFSSLSLSLLLAPLHAFTNSLASRRCMSHSLVARELAEDSAGLDSTTSTLLSAQSLHSEKASDSSLLQHPPSPPNTMENSKFIDDYSIKETNKNVANFKVGGMTCGACVEVSGNRVRSKGCRMRILNMIMKLFLLFFGPDN